MTCFSMMETPPRAWGRLQGAVKMAGAVQKHPHERGEDLPEILKQFDGMGNTPTSVGKT